MPSRPSAAASVGGAASHLGAAVSAAVSQAAAHGAWFDGWSAAWGVLLAGPGLWAGGTWSRIAAVGAVVWLLTWSRDLEAQARPPASVAVPGGRWAPGAAALAVATLLGTGPLAATAAWLAVGVRAGTPGAPPSAVRAGLRRWLTALVAWLSLGGGTAAGTLWTANGLVGQGTSWLGAHAADVAILAGCAFLVRSPSGLGAAARPGLVRGAAFALLGAGLATADRPAGLWIAALCAAAVWPRGHRASVDAAAGWERWSLPLALAAICAMDRLFN